MLLFEHTLLESARFNQCRNRFCTHLYSAVGWRSEKKHQTTPRLWVMSRTQRPHDMFLLWLRQLMSWSGGVVMALLCCRVEARRAVRCTRSVGEERWKLPAMIEMHRTWVVAEHFNAASLPSWVMGYRGPPLWFPWWAGGYRGWRHALLVSTPVPHCRRCPPLPAAAAAPLISRPGSSLEDLGIHSNTQTTSPLHRPEEVVLTVPDDSLDASERTAE